MTHKLIPLLVLFFASISFAQDFRQMGSNYYAYSTPTAKYTKAPAGYKPFYISHYGRHGSRFHQPADHYHFLYSTLAKADSAGKLTDLGKSMLERAKYLDEYDAPRAGDLTQLGVAQHQGIAKRMVKNFPEVFKNDAYIEAYASTSVRCVVSMAAFLEELRAQKPKLDIHQESGKYLMSFINPLDFGKIISESNTPAWQKENEKMYSHVNPARMMHAIFNDSTYVQKNVDAGDLLSKIYEIGNSLQGSPEIKFSFDDLWTEDELFARWRAQNAWWYSVLGNNPFGKKEGLENARPLLKNVLEMADKVIAADTTSAKTKRLCVLVAPRLLCITKIAYCFVPYFLRVSIKNRNIRVTYPSIMSKCNKVVTILLWQHFQDALNIVNGVVIPINQVTSP